MSVDTIHIADGMWWGRCRGVLIISTPFTPRAWGAFHFAQWPGRCSAALAAGVQLSQPSLLLPSRRSGYGCESPAPHDRGLDISCGPVTPRMSSAGPTSCQRGRGFGACVSPTFHTHWLLHASLHRLAELRGRMRNPPHVDHVDLSGKALVTRRAVGVLLRVVHCAPSLHTLHLNQCRLTDKAVVAMLQAMLGTHGGGRPVLDVTDLSLRENHLSHAVAPALAEFVRRSGQLRVLDLSDNTIGDKGAATLLPSLPHSHTLRSIMLSNTGLTASSAHVLAAQEAQRADTGSEPAFDGLGVAFNPALGDTGVCLLATALSGQRPDNPPAFASRAGVQVPVVGVSLDSPAPPHAPQPTLLQGLCHLDLRRVGMGPAGAASLALALQATQHAPRIQTLRVAGNSIGDEGVAALARAATLHLSAGLTTAGIAGSLQVFDVEGCAATDACVPELLQCLLSRVRGIVLSRLTPLPAHCPCPVPMQLLATANQFSVDAVLALSAAATSFGFTWTAEEHHSHSPLWSSQHAAAGSPGVELVWCSPVPGDSSKVAAHGTAHGDTATSGWVPLALTHAHIVGLAARAKPDTARRGNVRTVLGQGLSLRTVPRASGPARVFLQGDTSRVIAAGLAHHTVPPPAPLVATLAVAMAAAGADQWRWQQAAFNALHEASSADALGVLEESLGSWGGEDLFPPPSTAQAAEAALRVIAGPEQDRDGIMLLGSIRQHVPLKERSSMGGATAVALWPAAAAVAQAAGLPQTLPLSCLPSRTAQDGGFASPQALTQPRRGVQWGAAASIAQYAARQPTASTDWVSDGASRDAQHTQTLHLTFKGLPHDLEESEELQSRGDSPPAPPRAFQPVQFVLQEASPVTSVSRISRPHSQRKSPPQRTYGESGTQATSPLPDPHAPFEGEYCAPPAKLQRWHVSLQAPARSAQPSPSQGMSVVTAKPQHAQDEHPGAASQAIARVLGFDGSSPSPDKRKLHAADGDAMKQARAALYYSDVHLPFDVDSDLVESDESSCSTLDLSGASAVIQDGEGSSESHHDSKERESGSAHLEPLGDESSDHGEGSGQSACEGAAGVGSAGEGVGCDEAGASTEGSGIADEGGERDEPEAVTGGRGSAGEESGCDRREARTGGWDSSSEGADGSKGGESQPGKSEGGGSEGGGGKDAGGGGSEVGSSSSVGLERCGGEGPVDDSGESVKPESGVETEVGERGGTDRPNRDGSDDSVEPCTASHAFLEHEQDGFSLDAHHVDQQLAKSQAAGSSVVTAGGQHALTGTGSEALSVSQRQLAFRGLYVRPILKKSGHTEGAEPVSPEQGRDSLGGSARVRRLTPPRPAAHRPPAQSDVDEAVQRLSPAPAARTEPGVLGFMSPTSTADTVARLLDFAASRAMQQRHEQSVSPQPPPPHKEVKLSVSRAEGLSIPAATSPEEREPVEPVQNQTMPQHPAPVEPFQQESAMPHVPFPHVVDPSQRQVASLAFPEAELPAHSASFPAPMEPPLRPAADTSKPWHTSTGQSSHTHGARWSQPYSVGDHRVHVPFPHLRGSLHIAQPSHIKQPLTESPPQILPHESIAHSCDEVGLTEQTAVLASLSRSDEQSDAGAAAAEHTAQLGSVSERRTEPPTEKPTGLGSEPSTQPSAVVHWRIPSTERAEHGESPSTTQEQSEPHIPTPIPTRTWKHMDQNMKSPDTFSAIEGRKSRVLLEAGSEASPSQEARGDLHSSSQHPSTRIQTIATQYWPSEVGIQPTIPEASTVFSPGRNVTFSQLFKRTASQATPDDVDKLASAQSDNQLVLETEKPKLFPSLPSGGVRSMTTSRSALPSSGPADRSPPAPTRHRATQPSATKLSPVSVLNNFDVSISKPPTSAAAPPTARSLSSSTRPRTHSQNPSLQAARATASRVLSMRPSQRTQAAQATLRGPHRSHTSSELHRDSPSSSPQGARVESVLESSEARHARIQAAARAARLGFAQQHTPAHSQPKGPEQEARPDSANSALARAQELLRKYA